MSMLNIGLSGLNAAQIALNVTAQNIANVNTIGYSRQEAMMGSLSGFGRLDNGMGVEVTGVRRITDDYLVSQHWRSRSSTGASYSFHQYINTTEQLLGSESMNIAKGLDSFFASLSAALDSPETPAQRSQIVSSAGALANRFGQLNESMLTQEKQIDDQLNSTVSQVNSYLKQVAELNTQISEQASKGVNTSVLEDSREQIVRELSTFMEVRVNRQSDGSFSLSLPQGQPLVLAGSSSTLSLAGDSLSLSFGPQSFDVPKLHGGSLAGVIEYRTTVLRPLRDELNQIAKKLADDFNAKQSGGVDLHGNPGKSLFTYDPLNPSGTLKIADGFTGDDLAFAKAGGGSGDNRNLQELLTIKDSQYDAYSALLGRMAVQSGQAKATMEADANMEKQLATKLSSVSGVNTDEEGVKIMAYTKAYQANAKVISTSDQLFNSILNMF
ncbi:flagellar basal body rod protein FlgC [Aeromonas salmonicida subsp. salmonicida]|uniref:Flagellar hook-associated protein 1 n=2 Tax=Aeromonas salmonicida subsp. salmonicida TaxID=29491 RepID=A4SI31_AERS4|nr:lateral flagellar hook-associated protein LfgK [Aeromonas salmonicida]ABO88553.1 lateral flagellar hook-associated protein [Aeromonas salmonicida subsp. salmonicida A449]AYO61712.1 flagellar hook-associated protein FlgK [Aeromonas salmonicida subsp. salmonicida 01-B526]EHI52686.1 lateral flagellar hook-associated protein [Aeromonas salmonicida subsp. salmonicida 01-B526]EKP0240433.1 lateral flagellar hook-associated protein LfgK [Aeromonas salmonicida]EKP0244615.1 lateral flagellar hook-ass